MIGGQEGCGGRVTADRHSLSQRHATHVVSRVTSLSQVGREAQNAKSGDSGVFARKPLWLLARRLCHVSTRRHQAVTHPGDLYSAGETLGAKRNRYGSTWWPEKQPQTL